MNKKLLAVAVGAALAASAGISQADVKVYGVAHVSVDYVDRDMTAPAEVTNPWNVADNSSRFGIKAKEDLGGGWAGLAQFEIFVNNTEALTTNACTNAACTTTTAVDNSVTANRNNFVGIGHKAAGDLLLGRMDSAQKDVGGIADLFFREQMGESRAIINYGGADGRTDESVTFNSAKFGPVSFKLQWYANDSQTNTNNGYNANVKVDMKPVTVGVAYWKTEATPTEDTDGYRLAVKAPVGPVTLAALYQQVNSIGGVVGADRSARSRARVLARASSMFARLTQAMSSRKATAPDSTQRARRTVSLAIQLSLGCTAIPIPFASGYCDASCAAIRSRSARAAASDTPDASRPMTGSSQLSRSSCAGLTNGMKSSARSSHGVPGGNTPTT